MVGRQKSDLSEVKNVMADFGYSGENFANKIKELIGATVKVVKSDKVHTFKVIPRR
jgi:transposase